MRSFGRSATGRKDGAGDDVLEKRRVRHRPRQRAVVAEVVQVVRRLDPHAPIGRLESDDAAERGGDSDGAADVRACRRVADPAASAAAPTRRATRAVVGVPRVARDAVEAGMREGGGRGLGRRPAACTIPPARMTRTAHRRVVGNVVPVDERRLGEWLARDRGPSMTTTGMPSSGRGRGPAPAYRASAALADSSASS